MKSHTNTDTEWEKWGKNDPYFGVITHEKFRRMNLTEESKLEFFKSGQGHVNRVLNVCKRHFSPNFSPRNVLDFGCGTGRLIIPFSNIAENVVGIDISDSMLREAEKNCNDYSVNNVKLIKSDDNLSSLTERFDLIHSVIVFQHIPVERGIHIFSNLLNHLKEGGICAVQITYSKSIFNKTQGIPPVQQPMEIIANNIKLRIQNLVDQVKQRFKKPASIKSIPLDPEMQMNPYNLNVLFFLLQSFGITNIYLDFTDHGGELGIFLYFQKPMK